jgi:hypothetical protein
MSIRLRQHPARWSPRPVLPDKRHLTGILFRQILGRIERHHAVPLAAHEERGTAGPEAMP